MLIPSSLSSSLPPSFPPHRCKTKFHDKGKRMPAFVNGFLLAKDLPTDEDKAKFERLLGASPNPAVRNVTVAEQQQLACVKMSTDLVRTGRQTAYTKQYGPFDAGVDVRPSPTKKKQQIRGKLLSCVPCSNHALPSRDFCLPLLGSVNF